MTCLFDGNDCENYKKCKERIWHFLTDDLIVDGDNVMPDNHVYSLFDGEEDHDD